MSSALSALRDLLPSLLGGLLVQLLALMIEPRGAYAHFRLQLYDNLRNVEAIFRSSIRCHMNSYILKANCQLINFLVLKIIENLSFKKKQKSSIFKCF